VSARWIARCVTLAGLIALGLGGPVRATAQGRATAGGDLELGYGYDTNLFLDATPVLTLGQSNAAAPRADSLLHVLAHPRLALRFGGHAVDADYGLWLRQTASPDAILDHTGHLGYRTPRFGVLDLAVGATGERQAISHAPESNESFWLASGEGWLSAEVSPTTRIAAGYRHAWRTCPGLAVPAGGGTQRDREQSALLSGSMKPVHGLEIGLGAAFAHNASNDARLDYERARAGALLRWQALPWLALGADYSAAVQYLPKGAEDPLGRSGKVRHGSRTDVLHWAAAHATTRLARGLDAFARYDGSFASSNVEGLSYQRHQVLAGLRLSYDASRSFGSVQSSARELSALAPSSQGVQGHRVEFRLDAPQARSVAVIGDFNGWDPERGAMRHRNGGVWQTAVVLDPGRHVYSFLVNGVPTRPPRASGYVPDGLGGENGVVDIP
jgi:hypothetical protein